MRNKLLPNTERGFFCPEQENRSLGGCVHQNSAKENRQIYRQGRERL
jgi:hypothetical protein